MQMLIRGAIIGFALLAGVIGVGFLVPPEVHVERSIVIHAPPSTVFALVNGYRRFDEWSPWSKKDPNLKVERSGAEFGVGAKYSWSGNEDVGSGSQEIVASTAPSTVKVKLMFGDTDMPSSATFTIAPDGESSAVTWAFDTDMGHNPALRYFGLLFDKLIGPDYAAGLVNLKVLAEKQPATDFSALQIELVDNQPQRYLYASGGTTTEAADIGKALAVAYAKLGVYMKNAGLKQSGAPLTMTRRYDREARIYEFDAGIPVESGTAEPPANAAVKLAATPAVKILRATHKGPYGALGRTYEELAAFEAAYGFTATGEGWEQFLNDPGSTPETELLTTVNVPVK